MPFQLSACAEMLWQDRPIDWRAARLKEMGFGVGLWNWPAWDLGKLEKTGATFTVMNGFLQGGLTDGAAAQTLLASARESLQVGKRLGVHRLNLLGTALGEGGIPARQFTETTGAMWLMARDTLHRICDLAEAEGVTFTLENLNPMDHPGCPFATTADVLTLVSSVNRPQLRINLDLYHTQIGEGDLLRWCEKCLPWIGEVQIADNPGRFEPGTGEINFAGVARGLAKIGYSGPITMEAYASADPETALEAFSAAFTVQGGRSPRALAPGP